MIGAETSWAGNATWSNAPGSSDWNTTGNWVPATVPNGPADTATFSASTQTSVSLDANIEVSAIVFNPGASAFTIAANHCCTSLPNVLTVSGMGVTNDSGEMQTFVIGTDFPSQAMLFTGTATAGSATAYITNPGGDLGFIENASAGQAGFINKGSVSFGDSASAGDATFLNEGGAASASAGGRIYFNAGFAGNATFTNEGGTAAQAFGGSVAINGPGSAEQATFINQGGTVAGADGGTTAFNDDASTANAVLIANGGVNGGDGGSIVFGGSPAGGIAQVKLFGNGNLNLELAQGAVTIGSLEGDGLVFLGSNELIVGSNNLSTTFSGTFEGIGPFQKIGTGTLTLSSVSPFFNSPMTVAEGTLEVSGDGVLATGDVAVSAGATLRVEGGTTNDYIFDGATLNLVDGSSVDLNFSGVADKISSLTIDRIAQSAGVYGSVASGAMHQLPQFTGPGTLLVAPQPRGRLLNISTRLQALKGDNVPIGGFIVSGNDPKEFIVRGIGPSLENFGVPGAMSDPTLELHDASGNTIATNDNWRDTQEAAINDTGLAPSDDRESAILEQLPPAAYTVILQGKADSNGIGLVEVYDLDQSTDSSFANISTRGTVQTGDNVMIGGVNVGPAEATDPTLLVRALGPSLTDQGISDVLADPMLELRDAFGSIVATNDNWADAQQELIQSTGLAPTDDREAAIWAVVYPGNYTAIVTGQNDATGVALIEIYNLP